MADQKYEVKGDFRMGDEWRPYAKVVEAPNAAQAKERTFALIGSKHRLKRSYITVQSITLLSGE
ncbi:MAG: 50S ribosomal protein L18Ae [Methanoregulaceae archaeon PtaU1.Bin059]|jgi:large subunit ribosomal protein LX|nr:MAG: 50S ribosomal protein L18Ae [Methanoregulaceae archaeon PtaB.Bin009]OPY35778.1 MAG: 50S ribosomal protein L18Ae [Methanoregulaceae archaeon PtaU1.Bin059]HII76636.1 50S ribosomal protein L18a [Methanolinea sp.]HNQ28850.1 50S ribosomal protein L18Ae [Methanolinea sp.]HNS82496.1 50S ribosomal protein L18Ae [Methanolinea sp.]